VNISLTAVANNILSIYTGMENKVIHSLIIETNKNKIQSVKTLQSENILN